MNKKIILILLSIISFITLCKASVILRNEMIESGNEIQAPFHFSVMILLFCIVLLIFSCAYSKIVSRTMICTLMTLQILSITIEIFLIKSEFEFLNTVIALYILAIICYILHVIFIFVQFKERNGNEEKSTSNDNI